MHNTNELSASTGQGRAQDILNPIPDDVKVQQSTLPIGYVIPSLPLTPVQTSPARKPNPGAERHPKKMGHIPSTKLQHLKMMLDPTVFLQVEDALAGGHTPPIYAITNLATIVGVCDAFGLLHPEIGDDLPFPDDYGSFPAPIVAGPSSTIEWEIADAELEGWLDKHLKEARIDVLPSLTCAAVMQPGALLPTFCYLYQVGVQRSKEASCRLPVDIDLLTVLSILSGAEEIYHQWYCGSATTSTTDVRTCGNTPGLSTYSA